MLHADDAFFVRRCAYAAAAATSRRLHAAPAMLRLLYAPDARFMMRRGPCIRATGVRRQQGDLLSALCLRWRDASIRRKSIPYVATRQHTLTADVLIQGCRYIREDAIAHATGCRMLTRVREGARAVTRGRRACGAEHTHAKVRYARQRAVRIRAISSTATRYRYRYTITPRATACLMRCRRQRYHDRYRISEQNRAIER